MKKIAMILSGAGYLDGTEITEAVSLWISLDQLGASVDFFAPDVQVQRVDHLQTDKVAGVSTSSLHEAARICRSKIQDRTKLQAKSYDALVFPGGYGAAKVLCNWAEKGANCQVQPDVEKAVQDFYKSQKPIAACCIAPVVLAKVLGAHGILVTVGNDQETHAEIRKTGAKTEDCPVTDFISDRDHRILTTPAYMYEARPSQVFTGIQKLAQELVELA